MPPDNVDTEYIFIMNNTDLKQRTNNIKIGFQLEIKIDTERRLEKHTKV